jgi:signal transduction histidine kinase
MPTAFLDEDVDSLTRILIPVGLAISLLTPLAGYWLALRATSPIAGILRTAERLKPTRLGDRLDVRGTHDELDRVSLTINRLLDQVAGYVERQQQFVTDAAHELRGPLAAIQNSLEVASAKERSSEDYLATLDVVLEETKHLSKMANDLLLLAEGESDAPIAFAEEVDLDAVLRQTANMFAGVAEDRAIQLLIHSPQSLRRPADQRQLCQVVSNLLDNSMRFTPAGGCLTLSLALDAASQEAVLRVADTGCGIHEQYQTRVFDRFFQVDAARDRSTTHRGGGLGLAICRSIVERHGGQIDLTSQMGQGTTVTVRLPL